MEKTIREGCAVGNTEKMNGSQSRPAVGQKKVRANSFIGPTLPHCLHFQ